MSRHRAWIHPLLFTATLCLLTLNAQASGIHQWRDAEGNVHFGDKPPTNVSSTVVDVKPNVYTSPTIERNPIEVSQPKEVVLYSTQWCTYCRQAREYFTANGFVFSEYDVENHPKGIRDYARLGAAGVPVILVGKKRMNGFSVSAFRQLMK